MKIKEAALIVKKEIRNRDAVAGANGLNTVEWCLRRVGSTLTAKVEDIADDVLAGRGVGSHDNELLLVNVAKDAMEMRKETAIRIAGEKTNYEEETLREWLAAGETLSIATGRDEVDYVWFLDEKSNWAVSLDGNETELTEAQIEELLA